MPVYRVTRDDLSRAFPDSPKLVLAFEQLFQSGEAVAGIQTAQAEATGALDQATVITLSPNDAFGNERTLAVDSATMGINDEGAGGSVIIYLVNNVVTQGGFSCTFNLGSDTALDLPSSGRVLTDSFLSAGPFASDAAAAAGGVALGRPYRRSDGVVAWRQA